MYFQADLLRARACVRLSNAKCQLRLLRQRLQMVTRLQAFCRMVAPRIIFLRLRYYCIQCQARVRMIIQVRWYKKLQHASIVVQMYTRRYLAQLLVWRMMDAGWNDIETMLEAACVLQQWWRNIRARKVR